MISPSNKFLVTLLHLGSLSLAFCLLSIFYVIVYELKQCAAGCRCLSAWRFLRTQKKKLPEEAEEQSIS